MRKTEKLKSLYQIDHCVNYVIPTGEVLKNLLPVL